MARMTVLSRSDIEKVHGTSLRMLSEVGVQIDSPIVLRLLMEAGVRADEKKKLVFLTERQVDTALKSAPRQVKLCSRGGKDFTIPQEGVQLISPDGQPAAMLDSKTGKKRPSTLKDLIDLVIIADALPEVDYIWPPVVATDMPSDRSSFYEFLVSIAYSSKHIEHAAATAEEANFQIEVGSAILGSKEQLKRRPIISNVVTPISPLRYDSGEVEGMVTLARHGIPLVQLSMGIAGAVTPVSIAGTLAVVNAENLCGLTISQIASPGAPSIYSSFSGVSDLKSGVFLCGTPDGILMDVAATEMAKHYSLPSCAGGPGSASRATSIEAGYQAAMTGMASMLVGSDMMVGLGGFDRSGIESLEKLVMDSEFWRWLKRLRAGVEVDEDRLGFDAVKRQGPGGTFLSDPHTLKYMRKELMIPQVTAYHTPGPHDYLKDDLVEHAKSRVKDILKNHKPSLLDKETADRVSKVAKKYGIVGKGGKDIFPHA
jgi:trimethylamine--corrinoid protein Co-methyltransferase